MTGSSEGIQPNANASVCAACRHPAYGVGALTDEPLAVGVDDGPGGQRPQGVGELRRGGRAAEDPLALAPQRLQDGLAGAVPEHVRAVGAQQRGGTRAVLAARQHQVRPAAQHAERVGRRACR